MGMSNQSYHCLRCLGRVVSSHTTPILPCRCCLKLAQNYIHLRNCSEAISAALFHLWEKDAARATLCFASPGMLWLREFFNLLSTWKGFRKGRGKTWKNPFRPHSGHNGQNMQCSSYIRNMHTCHWLLKLLKLLRIWSKQHRPPGLSNLGSLLAQTWTLRISTRFNKHCTWRHWSPSSVDCPGIIGRLIPRVRAIPKTDDLLWFIDIYWVHYIMLHLLSSLHQCLQLFVPPHTHSDKLSRIYNGHAYHCQSTYYTYLHIMYLDLDGNDNYLKSLGPGYAAVLAVLANS